MLAHASPFYRSLLTSPLCREHQLTSQMVGNWKQQFLTAAPQVFEQGDADSDEQARIAELERMVGRVTMELEIAKKASSLLDGMRGRNGRQP
jgi:transposase-like protein